MYKLIVLAAVLAVANGGLTYYSAGVSPIHHQVVHTPVVSTYNTAVHTPVVSAVHTPVVYSAHHAVASPVVYTTGTKIVQTHKPVEQHGYQIAY